mgnify:CR=1 FL=1|tara:strand:- start:4 stop:351 length:348 start_codon:yes stop_codon:yes gene_type:complete
MSWELFVQDWGEYDALEDLPDDFEPKSIGKKSEIIEKLKCIEPSINFTDNSFGTLENEHFSIEISMGDEEELYSFTMSIRGGKLAVPSIGNILSEMNLRATDGSTPYFFDIEKFK